MSNDDIADGTNTEREETIDGRSIEIDTGFYNVQVWGDPDDGFDEVLEKAFDVADRAKRDVEELDDRLDGGDRHYS